jgi:hypothetical protein
MDSGGLRQLLRFRLTHHGLSPIFPANGKSDRCRKTELPVVEWMIDEEG